MSAEVLENASEAVGDRGDAPYAQLVYYTPVRQYPAAADGKATALLAAYGLMLSVLLAFSHPLGELVRSPDHRAALAVTVVLAPLLGLILIGLVFALLTLFTPLRGMQAPLSYYAQIARQSREAYASAVENVEERPSLRDLMTHHHSLSVLCVRKFRLVESSGTCLRAAFVLWLLVLLRLAFAG